jgi:hypothetical protein
VATGAPRGLGIPARRCSPISSSTGHGLPVAYSPLLPGGWGVVGPGRPG